MTEINSLSDLRFPQFVPDLIWVKADSGAFRYCQRMMKSKMGLFLGGAALATLAMTGCGRSDKPAEAAPAAAPAAPAAAAEKPANGRAVALTANDTMKFNLAEIHAKPGEALAITLTNEGTIPKFSMGHNFVLLAADVDLAAFTAAAADAPTTEYVPASFRDRILASTKLLGPGESDTARFFAPKTPGHYPFLCAFPGHFQVGMKGELIVE